MPEDCRLVPDAPWPGRRHNFSSVGAPSIQRIRIEIEGTVQGVGFRPFVYRLAAAHRLSGWVRNSAGGVIVEAEGDGAALHLFLRDIRKEAPPLATISALRTTELPPEGAAEFAILTSDTGSGPTQISPDCDTCPDCLRELFDPDSRRFRYPFITCTNCGPRYSIITGTPYDRPFTTMAGFPMCAACRDEYETPGDRRFHAQPIACPECGPRLRLVDQSGYDIPGDPLEATIRLLRDGKIVAVKGTGGYHLAVDAMNDRGVRRLRQRKKRDEKPFALMVPDPAAVTEIALADGTEQRLLMGPERPIVLLRKRIGNTISPEVAPANDYFGIMLPSSPLHHLLLAGNFTALVMTSGNVSEEPTAYRDQEALQALGSIADYFLTHDREIHMRTDDSVIRVFRNGPLFLRRSRGYVLRGIILPFRQKNVLAVGGELKAAVCLSSDDRAFLSQHIGDLKNSATFASLEETAAHLRTILKVDPEVVAHDLHPDYLSTRYTETLAPLPRIGIQHHHAHMASCMAENRLGGDVIGVIFDGAGYGSDGTIWGGEFLMGGYRTFERGAHFRHLRLPGGDAAAREPYRTAFSCLHAVFGSAVFDLPLPCLNEIPAPDRALYLRMMERGVNSPHTSSCGRLFDAVASLLGVRQRVSYEGQAAIELEGLAEGSDKAGSYPFGINDGIIDFGPAIRGIVQDLLAGRPRPEVARAFHSGVAAAATEMCLVLRERSGLGRVVLSGGVFQNRLLSEELYLRLKGAGFEVFTHRLAPPNDGGLALGQTVIAGAKLRDEV